MWQPSRTCGNGPRSDALTSRIVGQLEVEPPLYGTNHQQKGAQQGAICTSSGVLATNLPLLPRRLQLPVALRVDLMLAPGEHVFRRDVPDGAIQTDVVVMLHVTLNQTPRILQR